MIPSCSQPLAVALILVGGCGLIGIDAPAADSPDAARDERIDTSVEEDANPGDTFADGPDTMDAGFEPPTPPVITGSAAVQFVSTDHDDDGNLYIVGNTTGTLEVGESIASGRAFVASYTAAGAFRWVKSWESTQIATAWDVVVPAGVVRVGGLQSGEMLMPFAFDAGGRQRAMAYSFSPGDGAPIGEPLHFRSPRGNVQCKGLSTAGGRLALAGNFIGELDVGLGPLPPTPSGIDHGYVIVLEADGAPRWARSFGGATVFVDRPMLRADGGAWAVGNFRNGAVESTPSAVGRDGLILQLAPNGDSEHVFALQSAAADDTYDIMLHEGGAVVGATAGADAMLFIDGLGAPLDGSAGETDGFVLALNNDGSLRWSIAIGGAGADQIRRLFVLPDGRIAAAGVFRGSVDVAGTTLVSAGEADTMVVLLDGDGAALDAASLGGAGNDIVHGLEPTAGGYWVTVTHGQAFSHGGRTYEPPLSTVFLALE